MQSHLPGDDECVRSNVAGADGVRVDVRHVGRRRTPVSASRHTRLTHAVRVLG